MSYTKIEVQLSMPRVLTSLSTSNAYAGLERIPDTARASKEIIRLADLLKETKDLIGDLLDLEFVQTKDSMPKKSLALLSQEGR